MSRGAWKRHVSDQVEVFARYDALRLDTDSMRVLAASRTLNFATLGLNWFPIRESRAVRFTADAVCAFNRTDALLDPTAGDTTTALLGSSKPGEVDFRLQWQMSFLKSIF